MANDSQTLLARRAARLGALSATTFPPFEPMPAEFTRRFPELVEYDQRKRREYEQLITALQQVLASRETT
jgi:hypothetical protein